MKISPFLEVENPGKREALTVVVIPSSYRFLYCGDGAKIKTSWVLLLCGSRISYHCIVLYDTLPLCQLSSSYANFFTCKLDFVLYASFATLW